MRTPVHTLPARYQNQVAEQLAPFSGAVAPAGKPFMNLIRRTRSRAIGAFIENFATDWREYQRRGWKCRRVHMAVEGGR